MHYLADAVDVGVRFGVDQAWVAVAGVAANAFGFDEVGGVTLETERDGKGVVAELLDVVVNGLHARLAGERGERVGFGVDGFGGIGAGEVVVEMAMCGEELFGAAVIGFEVGVSEWPRGRDAALVMEDAEIFGTETEERGAVDLGLATDEIGLLGMKSLV